MIKRYYKFAVWVTLPSNVEVARGVLVDGIIHTRGWFPNPAQAYKEALEHAAGTVSTRYRRTLESKDIAFRTFYRIT